MNKIILGNSLEKLKDIERNSVDSIVTDPPYELGFMGKKWDNSGIAYNVELWKECLRVLKPGGHLLSFGGTRTYHRMAVAIEDAGFEIRDMIEWVYGSGFPKSLNIGKAVDKLQGNERISTGEIKHHAQKGVAVAEERGAIGGGAFGQAKDEEITKGTSEYEGWGTALKPAHEPICMARKPLECKSVAENCLKWGTGGINIDESRVGTGEKKEYIPNDKNNVYGKNLGGGEWDNSQGRFPANLLHDNSEEVRECFPEQKSGVRSSKHQIRNEENEMFNHGIYGKYKAKNYDDVPASSGNASRFFKSIIYQAKASKSERKLDSYITIKLIKDELLNKLWKEENMELEELLKKVILEWEINNFNIDISGENIMVQCHKDFLFIIKTEINKITELKILNLLQLYSTNECTQIVNYEKGNGGNNAQYVTNGNLQQKSFGILQNKDGYAITDVANAIYELLLKISKKEGEQSYSTHPTVKPIALMEYLIKMITPKGGVVLDPFAGSGTTLVSAKMNGFKYIGIEMTEEYIPIIEARLNAVKNLKEWFNEK